MNKLVKYRLKYYKLDENKNAVPCSFCEWIKGLEELHGKNTKHVAEDIIDGKWISTIWLGLDHNWCDNGPPLIFETMVFIENGSGQEIYCERYSTWQEAEEGHKHAMQWVKDGFKHEGLINE